MYIGIGVNRGRRVYDDEALRYAAEHLEDLSAAERGELVDWFFSGSWLHEDDAPAGAAE